MLFIFNKIACLSDLLKPLQKSEGEYGAGFNKIIPSNRLFQEKDKTFSIEQNNAPHRHWFARFCPPLANTRSLEMLEGTLRIFAALHVNKTLKIYMLSFVKSLVFLKGGFDYGKFLCAYL
ncbi:IS1 transposase [Holospora undulata]|uniref:Uncharacterized protein n=1 Tax=Holospora undulata HU1 TaxID=1321371 RepID=A0A061JIH6_9PROT|nr:IS1 transposase [Holospora undulata]ETZ05467.1 hypothetical protein K737_300097 [Holospora undulata HU1]